MSVHHRLAMTVTTCAACFALASCAAGITSANPGKSPSAAASRAASSPAASPSQSTSASAVAGTTVRVDAPVGSFPVPRGAQVVANLPCGKQVFVELGSVTPVQASDFYNAALPQAGYRITDSTLSSDPTTGAPQGMAEFTFTGHGFTGLIVAMANLGADASADPSADPSMVGLPGSIAKNAVEISLTPAGATGTPTCPS